MFDLDMDSRWVFVPPESGIAVCVKDHWYILCIATEQWQDLVTQKQGTRFMAMLKEFEIYTDGGLSSYPVKRKELKNVFYLELEQANKKIYLSIPELFSNYGQKAIDWAEELIFSPMDQFANALTR